jgi:GNAT superfamily N-acetyltransferase
MIRRFAFALFLGLLVGAGWVVHAHAQQGLTVQETNLRAKPATVLIISEVSAEVSLNCGGGVQTITPTSFKETGTGWFIDPTGWVITNGHVVQPAHEVPRWLVNQQAQRDTLKDVDLGFAFLPRFWSKGYAFESASAVLAHARSHLGFKRIVAIVSPGNAPSVGLLEKLGFRLEGMTRLSDDAPEVQLFGLALSVTACYQGFNVRGGAKEVGRARAAAPPESGEDGPGR